MTDDRLPTKPVVSSLTGATREFAAWLSANNYTTAKDRDGMEWQIQFSGRPLPSRQDLHEAEWELKFRVWTSASPSDLVSKSVLDSQKDARLLELLNDSEITLGMRPLQMKASSVDEARKMFTEALASIHTKLNDENVTQIKRGLVERQIDQKMAFGLHRG